MLHALPFTTFGQLAALGLKATVYCSRCYEQRPIDPAAEHLRERCFATIRFLRTTIRHTGDICGCSGSVASHHPYATGNGSISTALIAEGTSIGAKGGSKKGLQSALVYDD
jgi:hypothetical protein